MNRSSYWSDDILDLKEDPPDWSFPKYTEPTRMVSGSFFSTRQKIGVAIALVLITLNVGLLVIGLIL